MKQGLMVGESLVGDGNEVAHIDLMIGSKDGPVGAAGGPCRRFLDAGPARVR